MGTLKKDILVTAGSQAAAACLGFASLAVISQRMGAEALGAYSNLIRLVGACVPLLLCGVPIYIVRELRTSEAQGNERLSALLFATGSIASIGLTLGLVAAYYSQTAIYTMLGGSAAFDGFSQGLLLAIFSMILAGNCIYSVAYSLWRGRMNFQVSACLQVLWAGTPVIAAVLAWNHGFQTFSIGLAASQLFVSVAALFAALSRQFRGTRPTQPKSTRKTARAALQFGAWRLPLFFCAGAVLAAGASILNVEGDLEGALEFGVAFTLIRYFGLSVASLGVVLLPKLRKASFEARADDTVRRIFVSVHRYAYGAGLAAAICLPVLAPYVISVPENDGYALRLLRFGTLAIPGLMCYEILRNVNDSLYDTPHNTYHFAASIVLGSVIGFVSSIAFDSLLAQIYVGVGSVYAILGLVTLWRLATFRNFTSLPGFKLLLASRTGFLLLAAFLPADYLFLLAAAMLTLEAANAIRSHKAL